MSSVTLNNFFIIQPTKDVKPESARVSIEIPKGALFTQLPDHPAANLRDLRQRAEKLQVLQNRLQDATHHQKRDQIIACIAGAVMVSLVASIVLGALFCPPVAIASAIALLVLGFISSAVVDLSAKKDLRSGYEMVQYADLFCVGIPRLMSHFLTRKTALENKVNPLQTEVRDDLVKAGHYLQQHIPAIREKLSNDIASSEAAIAQASAWQLPIQLNLADLHQALKNSRFLLEELNEKGQPMVEKMKQAGVI